MPDIHVNSTAVTALRDALSLFSQNHAETLTRVNVEIERRLYALDQARHFWRNQVDLRTARARACYNQAAFAAAMGDWVDCSAYELELHEAERRLAFIITAQDRFERVVEAYHRTHYHLRHYVLGSALPQAMAYLQAVLEGLDAITSIQLGSRGVDIPTKPVSSATPTPHVPTETRQITPTERREGTFGTSEKLG